MDRETQVVKIQTLLHTLMVELSNVANDMRTIAELVETKEMTIDEISYALRVISTAMTQMVNQISQ